MSSSTVDFSLIVEREVTMAGNYAVNLSWRHVLDQRGYNIYRAESRTEDPNQWYKINNKIIQVNYYQDRGFTGDPVGNDRIAWFYKVIPVDLSGSELALSRSLSETFAVPLHGMQQWVAPTIRARTAIMLDPSRFSAAEVVHFLVRKWAGEYCSCLDVRTRKVNANCSQCFGTGYSGGFELIEDVYCRVRSNAKKVMGSSGGITVEERTTGIISAYPFLTEGDIIIRKNNERFRIRNPKKRQIQQYTTAQSFELEKMQLYDMAYRFPAPSIVAPTRRVGQENHNVIGFNG
jgi:hypothetical protein